MYLKQEYGGYGKDPMFFQVYYESVKRQYPGDTCKTKLIPATFIGSQLKNLTVTGHVCYFKTQSLGSR